MIGTQGGKILLKDGKVQRGCECCRCNTNFSAVTSAHVTLSGLEGPESSAYRSGHRAKVFQSPPQFPEMYFYQLDFAYWHIPTGVHTLEEYSRSSTLTTFRKTFSPPEPLAICSPAPELRIELSLWHNARSSNGNFIYFTAYFEAFSWFEQRDTFPNGNGFQLFPLRPIDQCVGCANGQSSAGFFYTSRSVCNNGAVFAEVKCDDNGYEDFGSITGNRAASNTTGIWPTVLNNNQFETLDFQEAGAQPTYATPATFSELQLNFS